MVLDIPLGRDVSHTRLLDKNFKTMMPKALFQCGLATLALVAILFIESAVFRAAIVVAIASSAFINFVVPHSVAASSRRVLGGHIVAVIVGSAIAASLDLPGIGDLATETSHFRSMAAAISVGISTLIMVATDTEHPTAAGTALGLVIPDWSFGSVIFILSAALILSTVRALLLPKLTNLL